MSDKKFYTADSIESLSPLEFTRLRPQVYAGDCTYSTQLLVEIVSNGTGFTKEFFDSIKECNKNLIRIKKLRELLKK